MKDIEDPEKPLLTVYPPEVKAGFIKKVYSLLTLQLLTTVSITGLFMFQSSINEWITTNPISYNLNLGISFSSIIIILILYCVQNRHPVNIIMLLLFTICISFNIGYISAIYEANNQGLLILSAFGFTMFEFLCLTSYVMITKKDFSFLGAGLCIALITLLFFSLLCSLFPYYFTISNGMMGLAGTIIFSGYILYDTSQIIHTLGTDDHIVASIQLYLDIINLFLYVLQLLRGCDQQ